MIKSQHKTTFITLLILFGFFISLVVISSNTPWVKDCNCYENEKSILPKLALALEYSDIELNDTHVYRLFESVNFTVNTSKFSGVYHVYMEISFSDGSNQIYSMTPIGNNNYTYEYKPGYNVPLNVQNVSFLIYNATNALLNDHTTYTNFTIEGNCMANFRYFNSTEYSSEYHIGDILYAELFIRNFSSSGFDYDFKDWDITVVDSDNETTQNNLLSLDSNVNQFTLLIDNETFRDVNKIYYIKVNMTELNRGAIRATYFPLDIINSNPVITSVVNLSHNELLRTSDCTVTLNATDIETVPENLTLTMYIQDSEGDEVLQELLQHEGENTFSDTFSIPWYRPVGKYRINVVVRDEHGGTDSKESVFTVINNAPEIHSYTINGKPMTQGIAVPYGKNIVFSFNVSDIEGVSYITVALLDANNEWFNITRAYTGENTEIVIRTIDLISGTWFAYIYVIDSDGTVTSLIDDYDMAPQGITIIPDVLSNFIPWIVFFLGMSIGVLFGVGSIYKYFKSKYGESQAVSPKKKESTTKKKVKFKPIKKEIEKVETEEIETEKEEKDEIFKRKIKRQL